MNAAVTFASVPEDQGPMEGFADCHAVLLSGLREFAGLPPLQEAAQRARGLARQSLALIDKAVEVHHAEEEQELFTAVLLGAKPGAEQERVQALVQQLTEEHREIEAMWKRLRPQVSSAAAGDPTPLSERAVKLLAEVYTMHAELEEREFLPLAREILGRDDKDMAALGRALHLRHAKGPVGYL